MGVDKSVVARWASVASRPSAQDLAVLSAAVARMRPGFSALDWDRDQGRRLAPPVHQAASLFSSEVDTNTVEQAIRPLALTRKNSLFAGTEGGAQHWSVLASLIAICKLYAVEPQAYIEDVITKLVGGHPQSRLDELLRRAYAPSPVAAAA